MEKSGYIINFNPKTGAQTLKDLYVSIELDEYVVKKSYSYRNIKKGESETFHDPPIGGIPQGTHCPHCVTPDGINHDRACPGPYNEYIISAGEAEGRLYSEFNARPGPESIAPVNVYTGNMANMIQVTLKVDDYYVAAKISNVNTIVMNNVNTGTYDFQEIKRIVANTLGEVVTYKQTNGSMLDRVCGDGYRLDVNAMKRLYDENRGDRTFAGKTVEFYRGKMSIKVMGDYTIVFNAGGSIQMYFRNITPADRVNDIAGEIFEFMGGRDLCYAEKGFEMDPKIVYNTMFKRLKNGKPPKNKPAQPSNSCKNANATQTYPRPYPFSFSEGKPSSRGFITRPEGAKVVDAALLKAASEENGEREYRVPCTGRALKMLAVHELYPGISLPSNTPKPSVQPPRQVSMESIQQAIGVMASVESANSEINKKHIRAAMYGFPNEIDGADIDGSEDLASAVYMYDTRPTEYGGSGRLIKDSRKFSGLFDLNREQLLEVLVQCAATVTVIQPMPVFTPVPVEGAAFTAFIPSGSTFVTTEEGRAGYDTPDGRFIQIDHIARKTPFRAPRESDSGPVPAGHFPVYVNSGRSFTESIIYQTYDSVAEYMREVMTSRVFRFKVTRKKAMYKIQHADGTEIDQDFLREILSAELNGETGHVVDTKTNLDAIFGKAKTVVMDFMINYTTDNTGKMSIIPNKPFVPLFQKVDFDHTRELVDSLVYLYSE